MATSSPLSLLFSSLLFLSFISISQALPFVLFHGIADSCSHNGPKSFTELLAKFSGSQGFCVEIGNGENDSWFMPLDEQTKIACDKVKSMKELSKGYNMVGLSQGNLIGRGVIEFCDGAPPVNNYISLAGPHAGIASVPLCGRGIFCKLADEIIKGPIYSDFVQEHLAPSGFLKLPNAIPEYLEKCRFLPKLNNEIPDKRNATYKQRFSSLKNLVLIMHQDDKVLVPKETSWFGYYPDGAFVPVLPPQLTKLYTEDWIGLKTLDKAGRVKFISVKGGHLNISDSDVKKYIVPYLNGGAQVETDSRLDRYFKTRRLLH